MAITAGTRATLLALSRGYCCVHHHTWLRRSRPLSLYPKSNDEEEKDSFRETLDLHHVRFRSLGGSDAIDNLIPICPTCHATLHRERKRGNDAYLPDSELRRIWQIWKAIPDVLGSNRLPNSDGPILGIWPNFLPLDPTSRTILVPIELCTYGYTVQYIAYAHENYKQFREKAIRDLVQTLDAHDIHFPFRRGDDWESYHFSCDPLVLIPNEWHRFTVEQVLREARTPIRVVAPATIVFNTGAQWGRSEMNRRTL